MAGYGGAGYGSAGYGSGGTSTVLSPPAPGAPTEPSYELGVDVYRFLIEAIRHEDQQDGAQFVERYLKGVQRVWDNIVLAIEATPTLWSAVDCPEEQLQYLKAIVGWTRELRKVTDTLDYDSLRRLIAASGALWRRRGPESEILNALNLVTGGARARIWNWFDFRWVLDETETGEEHEGRDPWVINLPATPVVAALIDSGSDASSADGIVVTLGGGETFDAAVAFNQRFRLTSGTYNGQSALVLSRDTSTQITLQSPGIAGGSIPAGSDWEVVDENVVPDDSRRSNLRIVDDGTLDRTLVKRVLQLMRAAGERFEINYLLMLDLFAVDGDSAQWSPLPSTLPTVAGGVLSLTDESAAQESAVVVSGAVSWSEYVVAARIRGHSTKVGATFGLSFYWLSADNRYAVLVDTLKRELYLRSYVGGVATDLVIVDLATALVEVLPDVFYTIRVSVIIEQGGANVIQVFVDGSQLVSTTDPGGIHTHGSVALGHDKQATVEASEVEVLAIPADADELGINESP